MNKISFRKIVVTGASVVAFVSPALALAQTGGGGQGNLGNIQNLASAVAGIISVLIPAAFALALLAFFWGVAKYIFSAGDEDAKATGQRIMVGGVIGIFVIAMIWGLVSFLGNALGISATGTQNVPTVTGQQGINP